MVDVRHKNRSEKITKHNSHMLQKSLPNIAYQVMWHAVITLYLMLAISNSKDVINKVHTAPKNLFNLEIHFFNFLRAK